MDQDRALAEQLVRQGVVTPQHASECLALLQFLKNSGSGPIPPISDLLLSKGYISRETHRKTAPMPDDVQEALATPNNDLGNFVLIQLLGRGGMGEVWRAWEKDLRRYVAIKFVLGHDPEDEKRFLREARVVAKLVHPNIAQIHDIGNHRERPYLVMQLVKGPTLDKAALAPRQLLKLIRDAALAIDFANQQGIVHRDIKPPNLMIEGERVFVMDFGLARSTRVDSSISQSGIIVGTPQFMSPEQAKGETRLIDARSDVYSLGATLYALMAGRPPFEFGPSENVFSLLRTVVEEEPAPPRKLNPSIPWEVETIILKAISKDRQQRYASAKDFADDVQRYLDGEPILARRAGITYRFGKKVVKHKWLFLAASLAVCLGLGFMFYVLGSRMSMETQKDRYLREAEDFERRGQWHEALGAYERAFALDPGDEPLHVRKDAASRRVHDEEERISREKWIAEEQKHAEEAYRDAMRELHASRMRSYRADWRLSEKDFQPLIDACSEQMKKTGESPVAWWIVGCARHASGDWNGAAEAYDAGLKLEPNHAWCLLYKARLLVEQSMKTRLARPKVPEACELFRKALAQKDVPEIERDLALAYDHALCNEGEDLYDTMLKKWQGKDFYEEFFLIHGFAHPERLTELATQAIRARPGFSQAYFWRGLAQSKTEEALADLDRALDINPRFAEGYRVRGGLYEKLGRARQAQDDFHKARELGLK